MLAKLSDSIDAAFFWRPAGRYFAPNLAALLGFAALGLLHPAFWILGAILELLYLGILGTNRRFRVAVARRLAASSHDPIERRKASLNEEDLARFMALEARCLSFLPTNAPNPALSDALGHLLRAYLELLITRARILALAAESTSVRDLQSRLRSLHDRLANPELSQELSLSLQSQATLVEQRLANWRAATDKVDLIIAELRRIEDHVELLREQELLQIDPTPASQHIDAVTEALRSTDAWIAEQQALFDIPAETPTPVPLRREEG